VAQTSIARVPASVPLPVIDAPSPAARREAAFAELRALVRRGAVAEGQSGSPIPGLAFHRQIAPATFHKTPSLGPTFAVVVQGHKVCSFGGTALDYGPAQYLVVTGETHYDAMVTEASPQQPYLSMCMRLDPDVIAEVLLALVDRDAEVVAETAPAFVADVDAPIGECLVRLLRAADDPVEREVVAPLVMKELTFRLLRSDAAAAVRSSVGRVRETDVIQSAMRFLAASVEQPVTVEDVARHVAMSPSHFAHRFRAVARVSPMRYLKQLRLHHARGLLLAGLRVSEAASRCGFESTSHFTRDFKAFYGAAPAAYARRLRT
jgi:AraC-like DNA-binding protein